ncbi:hypothetical protein A0J48_005415 [Sphaerospermopsis aphanizomenoides BCCUSP55]|uniref:hypothetical protein n=1 Tax=Sphaerospermopsis aphanizomenoides TaxID=459663 RepID=UPI000A5E1430|nr:hypothetical protein [Sphaerospermopsis aphanizomenoides]MBK1986983.1 hypothetical protein [Sphaerospermopsis aphanizomenoides BCCUSP55]
MYFIDNYAPIEIYNHLHSKIIYEQQFTPIKSSELDTVNESFTIKFSQESLNQKTPVTTDVPTNYLSQVPPVEPDKSDAPVRENSLQTEPQYPEQKPFKPQKLPLVLEKRKARPPSSPGITMLTPSAYGKSWGRASVGVGIQSRARFTDTADGVLGVGFGLGDARKSVGLDINIGVVDLDTFEDGNISFKLHRQLPADFAVAVGVKNFITFGDTDGGQSGYGVITKMFRLQDSESQPFSRVYVSAGVGGGQFRSESDISNQIDSVGVFGSIALRVAKPVNAIVEWSGQDLGLGVSVAPFENIPLVITPGISDMTGNAGDGTRFILGVGYSFSF